MDSDEERREIAFAIHMSTVDGLEGMSFQKRLAELCGVPGANWRDTMNAVADLIDPTENYCLNMSTKPGRFECSACGYEDDLTVAEPGDDGVHFCPSCGGRIVYVS
jgi:hypothetical protein